MQTTFRLGEIILCSLIALRRVLECVEHIFEYSLGPRMDVLAPEFQLPIGNHIALLRALFWDQSPNETRQNRTLSFSYPYSSRALSSWLHEQVTCFSCHLGVAFHIWQKELNLIGNVTALTECQQKH